MSHTPSCCKCQDRSCRRERKWKGGFNIKEKNGGDLIQSWISPSLFFAASPDRLLGFWRRPLQRQNLVGAVRWGGWVRKAMGFNPERKISIATVRMCVCVRVCFWAWTVWAFVAICLSTPRSHVQVLIQSDKRSEVTTTAHPLTHTSPHFLPLFKSAVAPSAFSLLPLHPPVTWHSYNPLRHVLMFEVYLFI